MEHWKGKQYNVGNENVNQLIKENLLTLDNVLYTPTLHHNLFSITKGISDGGTLCNKDNILKLMFKDQVINFDHIIKTSNRYVMTALIEPIGIQHEKANDVMNTNDFHQLTHQNKEHLRATAERLNIRLIGNLKPCIFCSKAMVK